ncbi:chemotaxis protein [Pseudomonas oryzihabitans]|uniref:EamA family transporter RarD n=1 Tax=Pseudomonas rhizoryzae TaxID=2571129 RepID=UPI0007378523|nr:EamA family transporter RarD [Pseudomonas rhizoryzae]APQ10757.1 chemotaxis protein [Pseudomonas psychrotolerans]KTS78701.1 chemotaxis protein [Pseudomonas psychrotolerans]KTS97909.1 chemotaxis protein [Pseudomonas psychrotolerans]KTT10423.1 chemotaxis protein [Pseudomonas psychrotolerans]KTT27114.1 chemotaxis protein [Pseudomonas psychrotolerans]
MSVLSGKGLGLSVLSSVLFALMPVYFTWLAPLDGLQVVVLRVIWSLPMVLLLVVLLREGAALRATLKRLVREPRLCLAIPVAALLMGIQWWGFVWATMNGEAMAMSLGYFLLPLAIVLTGRLVYGERLRPLQRLAVACALLGVINEVWVTGALSWVSLLPVVGYPPYFVLRRWMAVDALSGFVLEICCLLPFALLALHWFSPSLALQQAPWLWVLLPGLGLLSAIAFAAMLASSRLLPLSLFGILSYVEPALLVFVALYILGEQLPAGAIWTYGPIWLAVAWVCLDSARLLRKQLRRAPANP